MSKYDEERKKILDRIQANNVSFTTPSSRTSKYDDERKRLKEGAANTSERVDAPPITRSATPEPGTVNMSPWLDQNNPIATAARQAQMSRPQPMVSQTDYKALGEQLRNADNKNKSDSQIRKEIIRDALESYKNGPEPSPDPSRNIPVIGGILRDIDEIQRVTEPAAKVMQQFYTPGAGLTAVGAAYGAAQQGLSRLLPNVGRGAGLGQRVAREAITESALGVPLTAGNALAQNPGVSVKDLAQQTAIGAGLGAAAGAASPLLGRAISSVFRRNNVPEETVQEVLALPSPRQRGNVNRAETPSIIMDADTRPLGLPEPSIAPPTTARIAQQTNPYRQQFETLIGRARQLEAEGRFTPGREEEDLRSLWSQMGGRDAPSLDELIDLAYKPRPNRVTPDLVQRARGTQAAREVAGAPLPVRGMADRYQQGVFNESAPPVERLGRAPRQPEVLSADVAPQRPRVDVTPESPIKPFVRPNPGTQERGFSRTLRESPKTSQPVRESLRASYTPITNAQTVAGANRRISKGIDEAEAKLLGKTKFTAEDVATGMRLIDELQKTGNVQRAVSVAEKVAKQLTEAGQTVQAASIWNRLTPEGALLAAQRKVNTLNDTRLKGQPEVKISAAQAQSITDAAGAIQAAGVSRERAGEVLQIMDKVRAGQTVTPGEKQLLADFVADAKRFLKPADTRPPKPASQPKEMNDKRVRERVVSFMDAQEQAAKERLRAKGIQISSNPLDVWADYAVIGAAKLARGTVKFTEWSEQMVRELGESIRPYLRDIYEKSKQTLGSNAKNINEQVVSKAETIAEGYIKQKGDQLRPADVELIRNLAQRVSSLSDIERRMASQDLQAIIQGFEKVGIGRKLASAQYIAMLLNPLTQIRNIVGNELLYRLERIAKIASTPIDIAASKITGGPRTVTFKSGPAVWDDYFKTSKDFWSSLGEGAKAGWRGVSPEGLTTKYEIQGQAFRSKYNPLTYMEKALGAALQGFDYAAYTRATNQTMREMAYLDALNKGIRGDDAIRNHMQTFMANLDEATHNIARDYGKFVTLQNDSELARSLMSFRRGLNKLTTLGASREFGGGNIVMPFAKTPANLLLRAIDYSPAGILKAMKQTYDVLRNPNTDLTRADVILSVTRAMMGTGIGATAFWLADKGAIWGRSSRDPDVRKLNQSNGVRDFQINGSAVKRMIEAAVTGGDVDAAAKIQPGDTLWSYEWAQPTSMPIAIGSDIYQSRKEDKDATQTAGNAALAGVSTLLDSSVLSGVREALNVPPGEDNAFKAIGMNLLRQVPGQFVPSLARQFNTLFDDKLRESYAMPDDTLGKITNYAESSIPGLAQQMPQRVSTLGEPQTRLNTFIDVFLSPAARSKYKPTPEAQLVIDLLNETGDNRVAPRAVAKYISGKDVATGEQKRIDLTPEQYVELQSIVGRETAERLKRINPSWPTEKKTEMVIKAFDEAGKIGRNKLKRDLGLRITK